MAGSKLAPDAEEYRGTDFAAPVLNRSWPVRLARHLPERLQDLLRAARYHVQPNLTFYNYDTVWAHILREEREAGISEAGSLLVYVSRR